MNPIIANLIHQIAIKQTSQNLRHLKSTTNQNMKIPLILNKDSQVKIASLEAENARLKASVSPNIITIQNAADQSVVPVTTRTATGKITTRNMSLEDAARHSRKVVAGFTSRPSKAPRATANAPTPAPSTTPLPASKEVAFEPTPTLKPLTRAEFNAMTPHDRTRFAVQGGRLK